MLDLFDARYGKRIAVLLLPAALLGELFWSAAILAALGTTLSTLLGLPFGLAVVGSSLTAVLYTRKGGLGAVSRTDVLQLACIAVGLCLTIPFLLAPLGGLTQVVHNYQERFQDAASLWPAPAAFSLDSDTGPWGWMWLDSGLLLIFGGIPWQVYFQRILATRNARVAVQASIWAGVGCLLMALPAVVIGAVGVSVDWRAVGLEGPESPALILPYLLRHMTPPLVAAVGLGAVAAAVMSSVDSSFLSAASMVVWNFRRPFGKSRSDESLQRSLRRTIVVMGALATAVAMSVQSVYTLWYLCADVVYTVLFPQLVAGLYFRRATPTGAVAGVAVGLLLRLGGGEALLGLPAFLPYPMTDPELGVLFPFRTAAMVASLATIWVVSRFTEPSSS